MLPSRIDQNVSNDVQGVDSSEKSAVIESPRISVIVAVLNGAEYLIWYIESIARQSPGAYELVIIDGGSTDGIVDLLRSYKRMIDHWQSLPDRGVSDAWNKESARATGDRLCVLGADDYWVDSTMLAQAAFQLKDTCPQ
jgi:glycosyltransferase involved in cell wall biosynthesis